MQPPPWNKQDFETALYYLADHEEEARSSAILDAGYGVTVILPHGLPSVGMTFHGIFMLAPIFIFFIFLGVVIAYGLLGGGPSSLIALLVVVCILLFWGLTKALKLLLKSRELFPRRYFVTLGSRGIAMHFAWWQIPGRNSRAAIPWKELKSVRRGETFFLSALLRGATSVATVEVESLRGEKAAVPVHLPGNESAAILKDIEEAIRSKSRNRG